MRTLGQPENSNGFRGFSCGLLRIVRRVYTLVRNSPLAPWSRPQASRPGAKLRRRMGWPAAIAAATLLLSLALPCPARSQQAPETKIPRRSKIQGGDNRQAFTGKVQTVDAKLHVLTMKAEEGTGTELFPLRKNVDVRTAEGDRRTLSDLKVGADVVVYYEFKGSQREVKRIILLSPGSPAAKKKADSPS